MGVQYNPMFITQITDTMILLTNDECLSENHAHYQFFWTLHAFWDTECFLRALVIVHKFYIDIQALAKQTIKEINTELTDCLKSVY